jgi:hypothetical protein
MCEGLPEDPPMVIARGTLPVLPMPLPHATPLGDRGLKKWGLGAMKSPASRPR